MYFPDYQTTYFDLLFTYFKFFGVLVLLAILPIHKTT